MASAAAQAGGVRPAGRAECRPNAFISLLIASVGWLLAAATGLYSSLFLSRDWGWFVIRTLAEWDANGLISQLAAPAGLTWQQATAPAFAISAGLLMLSRLAHGCSCGRHGWLAPSLVVGVLALSLVTSVSAIGITAWRIHANERADAPAFSAVVAIGVFRAADPA